MLIRSCQGLVLRLAPHADGGDVTSPNSRDSRQNIPQLSGVLRASLFKPGSCPRLGIAQKDDNKRDLILWPRKWQVFVFHTKPVSFPSWNVHVCHPCVPSRDWISLQITAACVFRSPVVMVEPRLGRPCGDKNTSVTCPGERGDTAERCGVSDKTTDITMSL